MIVSSSTAAQHLWSLGIVTRTSFPSLSLAHCNITTHLSFSAVLSEVSCHKRHHSVNVEYSYLQGQFTPTEILKLFILCLFSSSFCLKYSLHFTGQSNYFTRQIQSSQLACQQGVRFGDTKVVLLFLNLVKYSYPCAVSKPLLWESELGLTHLKESKHFCIAT